MLAPSTWKKSPISASLNLNDATAQGMFAHISTTYLTQIMQHFHRTQSMFSKFSETFPLPHPDRICWPLNFDKNRLSPRRSTSTTLQLRASMHIFLQRIWHKLCNIFLGTQSIFSKFSETFPLPHPDRICWPPQLPQNRLSPRRSTLTTLQLRASLHIFLQRILHKLCIISIELRVCFPNLAKHFLTTPTLF